MDLQHRSSSFTQIQPSLPLLKIASSDNLYSGGSAAYFLLKKLLTKSVNELGNMNLIPFMGSVSPGFSFHCAKGNSAIRCVRFPYITVPKHKPIVYLGLSWRNTIPLFLEKTLIGAYWVTKYPSSLPNGFSRIMFICTFSLWSAGFRPEVSRLFSQKDR